MYSWDFARTKNTASLDEIETKVNGVLQKLHALSIGSGLGNDAYMSQSVARAIRHAKKLGLPMVLDADSLAIVSSEPDLIHGYKQAVLTPNAVEFSRMCKSLGLDIGDSVEAVRAAARALGGVTIIKKGSKDIISDGNKVFVCEEESGLRRCGGQGDILSGAIATFMAWGQLYLQNVWDHHGLNTAEEIPMLAAFAGSMLTKAASNITYKACGRSTQTSDILKHLPKAFDAMFS
ncbi:hypothetical protein EV182_005373 [Spiromyces aspiralis]|uniref:Uncharacterized protein n=1 Tax=Spiromyces aspiralis TaxID=68401 RepID=A0ACC1HA22_9FUNG|nr:hypothetical protein EV182_005373 [Spiromyces aspiralis]